eukprot:2469884-Amphidinium_carterae.2
MAHAYCKDEGMPTYKNPFIHGNLFLILNIKFPEKLEPDVQAGCTELLRCRVVLWRAVQCGCIVLLHDRHRSESYCLHHYCRPQRVVPRQRMLNEVLNDCSRQPNTNHRLRVCLYPLGPRLLRLIVGLRYRSMSS